MTKFYQFNPECPGSLGNDAVVVDRDAAIWQLSKFQIVLGFELAPMEVAQGDQLFLGTEERQKRLPKLVWLKIVGLSGCDDFGTSPQAITVVSEKALTLLKQFKLDNCDIEEWTEIEGNRVPQEGW